MLYGAIAASKLRPSIISNALFSGIGNLAVSGYITGTKQIAANFSGIGNLMASGSLFNPNAPINANFAGIGQFNPRAFINLAGEDPATSAWADMVALAGGTVSEQRRSLVNDLIAGLKSDSLWTKLDRLWLFAAENQTAALVDLVHGVSASIVTGVTFDADRGFTGGGSGSVQTGFNPTTSGQLYGRDDAHWGYWGLTNPLPAALTVPFLYDAGSSISSSWISFTDNNFYCRVNDNGTYTAAASAFTTNAGLWIGSRAGAAQRTLYVNGVLRYTTNAASQALTSNTFKIVYDGKANQCAAFSVGANLQSGSDALNFYNRLKAYMISVGIAVQPGSSSMGGSGNLAVNATIQ